MPVHLVQAIGKKVIQLSLNTASFKEAKQRRAAKDLEWDAQFEAIEKNSGLHGPASNDSKIATNGSPLSNRDVAQLVRDYVERERYRTHFDSSPPDSEQQKEEMRIDLQIDSQIIRDWEHPNAHRSVYLTGKEILEAAGRSIEDPALRAISASRRKTVMLHIGGFGCATGCGLRRLISRTTASLRWLRGWLPLPHADGAGRDGPMLPQDYPISREDRRGNGLAVRVRHHERLVKLATPQGAAKRRVNLRHN